MKSVIRRKGNGTKNPHAKPGRPASYTEALGEEICRRIGQGETLTRVCSDPHMPSMDAVWRWIESGRYEGFTAGFARARMRQSHALASEALDLIRGESNFKKAYLAKAKADVLLQVAARLNPAEYSERWNQLLLHADGGPVTVNVISLTPPSVVPVASEASDSSQNVKQVEEDKAKAASAGGNTIEHDAIGPNAPLSQDRR